MWSSNNNNNILTILLAFLILTFYFTTNAEAHQIHDLAALDWSSFAAMSSIMGDASDNDGEMYDFDDDGNNSDDDASSRRSLYWRSRRRKFYYISYGALSANRVPCPPRSGRSYYTHNCFRARAPANPYHRGCSCISRCRR